MKKFLSLVLALVMTMSLVTVSAGAKDFTDDSEITYKEAVDVISALGVVDGYSGGDFRPDDVLTRGAAAKIICNLILGPTTASALAASTAPFKDVPVTNTFAGYITYCSQQGIISGYADGTFRPTGTLSGNAFMKMLLGALGYDSKIENYTGANWTVSVIKQAVGIGLDDGNDEFVGSKAVTRQEAALYAFNMLQATMVEYDQQNTIVVGDITINTTSSRKDVANTANNETIANDNKMQFAEKYFDDLKLSDGTDDFARPANVWRLKSEKIGTYAKEADATYTAKVAVDDIYADLDLGSSVDKKDVSVYVDGVENTKVAAPVDITKNDDDTKFGANGVLTEVFYDDDDDTVVITMVNTYVGTINRSVAAKGNKAAYVEIAPEDVKPDGVNGIQDFETAESFEDDAYVLYTYSQSADEVKSVALAEEVTGTVTRAENNAKDEDEKKALTIGGTRYTASHNIAGENIGNVSVDEDYTVYLDSYGYLIYVKEIDEIGDYALLVNSQDKSDFSNNRALLVFADGTEKVVDTTENYKYYAATKDGIPNGTIVTYRVDEDGDYTLKAVKETLTSENIPADDDIGNYTSNNKNFSMENDKATVTLYKGKTVTTNSSTVFVVYNDSSDDYTVYTGIKNAPSIDGTASNVESYAYCKSGKMATIMFVFVQDGSAIEDDSNSTLFLAKESVSNLIHDKDGDYFEYQAVVNGEVQTVKVDESLGKNLNGMYKNYSVDKYGVITKVSTNGANGYVAFTDGEGDSGKEYLTGAGIDKISADYTVLLDTKNHNPDADNYNTDYTITVADDAKIFYVDEDGNIEASSYRAIAKDSNDKVYAVVDEYLVEYLVIEEVDDKASNDDKLSTDIEVVSFDPSTGDMRLYVEDASKYEELTVNQIGAWLEDQGYENVEYDAKNDEWSFTEGKYNKYEGITITQTQVFEIDAIKAWSTAVTSVSADKSYVADGDEITITIKKDDETGFNNTYSNGTLTGTGLSATLKGTLSTTKGDKVIKVTFTVSSITADVDDATVTLS